MFLHEKHAGPGTVHGDAVNAVADLRLRIGDVLRFESAIDWLPGLAAVVAAKRPRGRNRNEYPVWIAWIQHDRVQTHPARAGLPFRPRRMAAQTGQFVPGLAAVLAAENRGVLHARIDGIR